VAQKVVHFSTHHIFGTVQDKMKRISPKRRKGRRKKRKQEEEKKGYGGKDLQKSKVLSRELKSEWAMEW